ACFGAAGQRCHPPRSPGPLPSVHATHRRGLLMPRDGVPKLVLISPVNEATVAESALAPRLSSLRGKRVGLLDNSKSKADKILDMVAAILNAQYGFTNIVRHRKPSASKPA